MILGTINPVWIRVIMIKTGQTDTLSQVVHPKVTEASHPLTYFDFRRRLIWFGTAHHLGL